jgi:hypothetical protein
MQASYTRPFGSRGSKAKNKHKVDNVTHTLAILRKQASLSLSLSLALALALALSLSLSLYTHTPRTSIYRHPLQQERLGVKEERLVLLLLSSTSSSSLILSRTSYQYCSSSPEA